MKKVLVCGAGGFIGSYLVSSLKEKGYYVIGADLKKSEYWDSQADEFHVMDLRNSANVEKIVTSDLYEIYQLAADMGGAGYIFTGENDADIMHNSATINLNIVHEMVKKGVKRVFYTSSACMYPEHNQLDSNNPHCEESSAYPANPDPTPRKASHQRKTGARAWRAISMRTDKPTARGKPCCNMDGVAAGNTPTI
jgi:nucleoside-diphosphate-sugar epimerase